MSSEPLTAEQIEDFHRDGYLIIKSMFDTEEMELLKRAAKEAVSYTHLTLPTILLV